MKQVYEESLPLNSAARNAVWVYPHLVKPRFAGAPAIIETTRSHHMPDFDSLLEGADIAVELYGGAVTLRLRGDLHRIYIETFTWISFPSDEDARAAFTSLWQQVERLDSARAVEEAAQSWHRHWRARCS